MSVSAGAGTGSPVTRNVPRTRVAAGIRDSKCRSLAPLAAAALMNDSKSIFDSTNNTSAVKKLPCQFERWNFSNPSRRL